MGFFWLCVIIGVMGFSCVVGRVFLGCWSCMCDWVKGLHMISIGAKEMSAVGSR